MGSQWLLSNPIVLIEKGERGERYEKGEKSERGK